MEEEQITSTTIRYLENVCVYGRVGRRLKFSLNLKQYKVKEIGKERKRCGNGNDDCKNNSRI